MTLVTNTTLVSAEYRCDATGCTATLGAGSESEPLGGHPWFGNKQLELLAQTAQANGWTRWAGRSSRNYCAQHGPAKGSKLRRVW